MADHTSAQVLQTLEEAIADLILADFVVPVWKPRSKERFLIAQIKDVSDKARHEALLAISSAVGLAATYDAPSLYRVLALMLIRPQVAYSGDHIAIFETVPLSAATSLEDWQRRAQRAEGDLPSWLKAFTRSGTEEPTTRALADLIAQLEDLLAAKEFALLDRIMGEIDVASIHPTVAVAMLRVPYPVRQSLPNWSAFRERVSTDLRRRNMNADKILRGLTQ